MAAGFFAPLVKFAVAHGPAAVRVVEIGAAAATVAPLVKQHAPGLVAGVEDGLGRLSDAGLHLLGYQPSPAAPSPQAAPVAGTPAVVGARVVCPVCAHGPVVAGAGETLTFRACDSCKTKASEAAGKVEAIHLGWAGAYADSGVTFDPMPDKASPAYLAPLGAFDLSRYAADLSTWQAEQQSKLPTVGDASYLDPNDPPPVGTSSKYWTTERTNWGTADGNDQRSTDQQVFHSDLFMVDMQNWTNREAARKAALVAQKVPVSSPSAPAPKAPPPPTAPAGPKGIVARTKAQKLQQWLHDADQQVAAAKAKVAADTAAQQQIADLQAQIKASQDQAQIDAFKAQIAALAASNTGGGATSAIEDLVKTAMGLKELATVLAPPPPPPAAPSPDATGAGQIVLDQFGQPVLVNQFGQPMALPGALPWATAPEQAQAYDPNAGGYPFEPGMDPNAGYFEFAGARGGDDDLDNLVFDPVEPLSGCATGSCGLPVFDEG